MGGASWSESSRASVNRSQRHARATACCASTLSDPRSVGAFRPGDSDVDLLVEFGPMDVYARVDAYFDLLDDFRGILGTEVDLVMVDAVKNRYIAADIARTKQALYAA